MIFLNEKNKLKDKRNLLYSWCEFNSQWDTCVRWCGIAFSLIARGQRRRMTTVVALYSVGSVGPMERSFLFYNIASFSIPESYQVYHATRLSLVALITRGILKLSHSFASFRQFCYYLKGLGLGPMEHIWNGNISAMYEPIFSAPSVRTEKSQICDQNQKESPHQSHAKLIYSFSFTGSW